MSGQRPEALPNPEPGSGAASEVRATSETAAAENVSQEPTAVPGSADPSEGSSGNEPASDPRDSGTPEAPAARDSRGGERDGSERESAFDGFAVAPVSGEASSFLPEAGTGPDARIVAIVVTHKRRELLAESLKVLTSQTRPVDHLIVVDNANEAEVAELVEQQPIETTYLGSAHNLGGAGGFALGMLHALTLGADWVWLADDDGRPDGPEVLATLLDCAGRHGLVEVSPVVCDIDEPDRLAFPLRRGVVWRRLRSELGDDDFLPGIASLFNGALISAKAVDVIGVPDLRLFVRGDEVEVHRRLVRSGLPFGTCLQTAYLHPNGAAEFKPILGGRMHTQYPDDPVKRYFTYRNRGYLMSQPGMRKLLPQEWIRFSWFFLVTRRDPAGLREWFHLRSLGRHEQFGKPD